MNKATITFFEVPRVTTVPNHYLKEIEKVSIMLEQGWTRDMLLRFVSQLYPQHVQQFYYTISVEIKTTNE